jgi:hypothetical protein
VVGCFSVSENCLREVEDKEKREKKKREKKKREKKKKKKMKIFPKLEILG